MMRRYYSFIAVFIVLLLALAACGGANGTGGTPSAGDTGTGDTGTGATGQTGEQPLATAIVGTPVELGTANDNQAGTGGLGGDTAAQATASPMATGTATAAATSSAGDASDSAAQTTVTPSATTAADTTGTTGDRAMGQTGAGTIYVNDEFGFAVQIPAGWALREINASASGTPTDWPIVATWLLMPPTTLQQIQDQTAAMQGAGGVVPGSDNSSDTSAVGTPIATTPTAGDMGTGTPAAGDLGTTTPAAGDTGTGATPEATGTAAAGNSGSGSDTNGTGNTAGLTTSPVVAPFMIEVVVGDEAALQRAYPMAENATTQESQFGSNTANVMTFDPGYTQVVFKHPNRDNVYIVVTDWVSQFPGREAQAEQSAGLWQPMLASLAFTDAGGMYDFTGFTSMTGDMGTGTATTTGGTTTGGSNSGGSGTSAGGTATPMATATP